MSSQYGELRPINGWDRFGCLGHPSKLQQVSRLGFVAAATSLNGSQPNFARCLAISWTGTLYIHFWGRLPPPTEFCQLQKSLCIQVLRSPILAALRHGTRAAAVRQTLWRGITELSQTAPPVFGWAAITLGIGQHSSCVIFASCIFSEPRAALHSKFALRTHYVRKYDRHPICDRSE